LIPDAIKPPPAKQAIMPEASSQAPTQHVLQAPASHVHEPEVLALQSLETPMIPLPCSPRQTPPSSPQKQQQLSPTKQPSTPPPQRRLRLSVGSQVSARLSVGSCSSVTEKKATSISHFRQVQKQQQAQLSKEALQAHQQQLQAKAGSLRREPFCLGEGTSELLVYVDDEFNDIAVAENASRRLSTESKSEATREVRGRRPLTALECERTVAPVRDGVLQFKVDAQPKQPRCMEESLADIARRHDHVAHTLRQQRDAIRLLKELWHAGDASAVLVMLQGGERWPRPCLERMRASLEQGASPHPPAVEQLLAHLRQSLEAPRSRGISEC